MKLLIISFFIYTIFSSSAWAKSNVINSFKNKKITSQKAVEALNKDFPYLKRLHYSPNKGNEKGLIWIFLVPSNQLNPMTIKKLKSMNKQPDAKGRWSIQLSGGSEKILKDKLLKILVKQKFQSRNLSLKRPYTVMTQVGGFSVKSENDELKMNFFRIGMSYRLYSKFKSFWQITGLLVNFRNIQYSKSKEEKSPSSFYPELSLSYTQLSTLNLTYSLDYLNYFATSQLEDTVILEPSGVLRFAFRPSYSFAELWSIGGSLGLLKNTGGVSISGFDTSAGVSRFLNHERSFQLSLGLYLSNLKVNSERAEKSSAFSLSGFYHF